MALLSPDADQCLACVVCMFVSLYYTLHYTPMQISAVPALFVCVYVSLYYTLYYTL